jgi:hypothetical protein
MVLGLVSVLIVVACWLYAEGGGDGRAFVFRRSLRFLRAERAAAAVLREAAEAAKERI